MSLRKGDEVDERTLAILSGLVFVDGHHAQIAQPLERKEYERVNQVLEALGGRWSRRKKAHAFSCDAKTLIEQTIEAGAIPTETDADLGFFETPEDLAGRLVKTAGVRPGHHTLEPSAGRGRIVQALLAAGARVTAVERDDGRRRHLASQVDVVGARLLHVSLHEDFLDYPGDQPGFDRVVMNPAFCRSGKGDHLDHVRHAHAMLRPGGVLVSVLPDSLRFRGDRRHAQMREWVLERGTLERLPDDSFRSSGTGVQTVMIRLVA